MAIIKLGTIVTEIRGKVGGQVFQGSNSGFVLRNNGNTRKSSTSAQKVIHQGLQQQRYEWAQLTLSEQGDWNDFGAAHLRDDKYGVPRRLNGFNWFTSINHYRLLTGQTQLSSPPTYTVPAAVPSFTITMGISQMLIYFGATIDFSTDMIVVYATPILTSSSTRQFNQQRQILVDGSSGATGYDLQTEYNSAFNCVYPQANWGTNFRIAFAVFRVNKDSGIITPWSTLIAQYS